MTLRDKIAREVLTTCSYSHFGEGGLVNAGWRLIKYGNSNEYEEFLISDKEWYIGDEDEGIRIYWQTQGVPLAPAFDMLIDAVKELKEEIKAENRNVIFELEDRHELESETRIITPDQWDSM